MANPTEIRVTFTVDLKPYAMGLQTMLSMTQAAGKQILPVLNLKAKPDFSVFDAQLKQLSASVNDYISSQAEAVKAAAGQTAAFKESAAAADQSAQATQRASKSTSGLIGFIKEQRAENRLQNFLLRESQQAIGALSLAVTAFGDVGSNAMRQFTQTIGQGVLAFQGFNFALAAFGVGGPLGLAISGVAALGVTIAKFADDSEEKIAQLQRRMEMFSQSLRGTTLDSLLELRENLLRSIVETDKKIAQLEKERGDQALREVTGYGSLIDLIFGSTLTGYGKINQKLQQLQKEREETVNQVRKTEEEISRSRMKHADVEKRIRELNIEGERDKYRKMRAEADKALADELERAKAADVQDDVRKKYREAAEKVHTARISEINRQEQEERLRLQDEQSRSQMEFLARRAQAAEKAQNDQFEAELARIRQHGPEVGLAQEEIDIIIFQERKRRLQQQFLELQELVGPLSPEQIAKQAELQLQLSQIEEKEAQARVVLAQREKEEKKRLSELLFERELELIRARSDEEKQAELQILEKRRDRVRQELSLLRERQVSGQRLTAEEFQRAVELEINFTRITRQEVELRKQIWMDSHKFEVGLIDSFTSGFKEAFSQILAHQRQAKDEWDAAWLAMKNAAITMMIDLLAQAIKNAIVGAASATATAATTNAAMAAIIPTATTAATMTSIATFGGASIAGGAALATTLATMQALAKATVVPFEKGGRTEKGQVGFFEGMGAEIIAPEKTFYDIARAEMIPRLILEQNKFLQQKLAVGGLKSESGGMERVVERFERAVKRLEGIEWRLEGRDLKTVIRRQNDFDETVGIR